MQETSLFGNPQPRPLALSQSSASAALRQLVAQLPEKIRELIQRQQTVPLGCYRQPDGATMLRRLMDNDSHLTFGTDGQVSVKRGPKFAYKEPTSWNEVYVLWSRKMQIDGVLNPAANTANARDFNTFIRWKTDGCVLKPCLNLYNTRCALYNGTSQGMGPLSEVTTADILQLYVNTPDVQTSSTANPGS